LNIRRCVLVLVCATAALVARPALGQQVDIIRGRITGPDSLPVVNARVTSTSYYGNVRKETTTDKNGRFSLAYPNGEGDYWIEIAAIGFAPKRFEVKRVGEEEILIADTRLQSTIAQLDAVNVTTSVRALPNRNAGPPDVGGGEKPLTNANLPPDQMGNLAAMASGIPGIQLIPGMDGAADMFSALGLGSDQNSTTFNGLGSAIDVLPPDAQTRATVQTYSYDPAIGGFSGAGISLSTIAGSNFSRRNLSSNAKAPQLQFADSVAEEQGARNTVLLLGSGGGGPIRQDKSFYNYSWSAQRQFRDLQSLLNTSQGGLSSAGVAKDSANRLLDILRAENIPVTVSNAPRLQNTDVYAWFGNVDLVPSSSGTGHAFTLGLNGNYRTSAQVGSNPLLLSVPSHNFESSQLSGSISLRHTNYFWFGIFSNTAFGVTASKTNTEPYLRIPTGTVRVSSDLGAGNSAVRNLSFGGNSAINEGTNTAFEVQNQMSWYAGNNKHTVKLTSRLRDEMYSADRSFNTLGSFQFNSLADLEAGRPSSFTRTLFAPTQHGSQLSGAVSLGDYWRPTPTLQVTYGLRLDGNRFLETPDYNPAVAEKLGIRNDKVPNRAYLSPRVGFQWAYGTQNLIAPQPGAARPPRAFIQGGAGIFQNLAGANFIESSIMSTGLPGAAQSIACIGPAAPIPDWHSYLLDTDAIPTQCADGTSGTVFSNAAPSVNAFDRRFAQSRSLRSNLNWGGPILDNRFALGITNVYSLNLNQQSSIDANFAGVQRFALDGEANRPVYANVSAIDPRTGSISSRDTRIAPEFNRVTLRQSDLRSETKQTYITLKPVTTNSRLRWQLSYQLLDFREKFNGFTSTGGNPFDEQWGRGLQAGRHQFGLQWSDFPIFDVVFLSAGFAYQSGFRYTPVVQGDINGDGFGGNDRAFVYNPSSATDPELASSMQSLLDNGSRSARKCLSAQLGQIASRGSCEGPWITTASLSVRFNPQKIGLPKRANIIFSLNNPLGLADLIVHGNDLRGWGQAIQPDQSLLFVRGFDPATQRFKYEVNQRFGSTRPTQSTQRQLPEISLRVTYDIGYTRERQMLTQQLDIGRRRPGNKPNATQLKSFGTRTIPNPMALILTQPDSLKLTRRQADSLASLSRAFTLYADSVWTPAARYFESLPAEYQTGEAYKNYVRAREQTMDYLIKLVPSVKGVLTSKQKRQLPPLLQNYLDVRVLRYLRSSSAGNEGGGAFFIR
jgi:hypothetical protein